ncbi:8-oxo-dGTP diphosphatase [Enterococcus sp. DIV0212c]|uniref:NUDIX domain-containing protein n=1 Tax=Enterococcus sp. DIV0212c TaxID=2230867 RepID=UPI001A9B607A|nr:NUDIX domain-containing protein [Enterococcus sp. DIV0212c]
MKSFGQRNYELTYSCRTGSYGIITNQSGDYLVVQSSDGNLFLVGGKIEEGEDPITALEREAIEETGFVLQVNEFIGKAEKHWVSPQYSDLSQHNIGYFYTCSLGEKITDPIEDEPMIWVSLEQLEKNLFHEHHLYMIRSIVH